MSGDYGYGPSIGFLRFCDDPELACCRAEKDYLRLKAQEIDLYEKAMELECELTKLRKVAEAAKKMVKSNQYGYVPGHLFGKLEQAIAELNNEV